MLFKEINEREYDGFVCQSPHRNVLNSSRWALVKENWQAVRLGFYEQERLVAVCQILIKSLPLALKIMYAPRGPVMNFADEAQVQAVMDGLMKYARSKKALFFKFDPAILLCSAKMDEQAGEKQESLLYLKHLLSTKAKWLGRTKSINETIQPRWHANVYTCEDIVATFPKHTKRLMKDALSRDVQVERVGQEGLDAFAQVVELTESRKQVSLRNRAYFKKLMDVYGQDAYLHLAFVDIDQRKERLTKQLAGLNDEMAQVQPHQKKLKNRLEDQLRSCQKQLKELEQYSHYHGKVVIAGILSVRFGDVMEMLYAGMNDDFKNFYPQYLLYPKVFADAYQDGIVYANMGGIEGTLDDGLTKFKSNFNPSIEQYIGEFTLKPFGLLSQLALWAYQRRKAAV